MTQLGEPLPQDLKDIRDDLERVLRSEGYDAVDANSLTTGRDFLLKIWELILAVPMGIAVVHEDMRPSTIANVFYEMGLMQAYGKETLVVKTPKANIPSDFVRTEYVEYGKGFTRKFRTYANEGVAE